MAGRFLRQSTAAQTRTIGPFVDDTDFKTAEDGLTIANTDIRLKKNGAADVAKNSGGATADVNGCYAVTWDATDTDTVGELFYTVKVAGALQVFGSFTVLEEAIYDALFAASANAFQGAAGSTKVTGVVLVDTLTTYTGNTPQTGDAFARLGAPAGASVSADIAAIEAQTDDIGVAGAGLTAVPWNAAWDAEVESEVNDGLVAQRLDELLNADSDIDGAAPPTVGSVFHELMTKTAGSFTYDQTTDSLEAVRDRGDAAWITATGFSTHSAADVWASATRTLTAGTNIQLPSNGLANVTAWTVDVTGTWTGNVTGSVGSVTGAVGSVTGNVGGNVTGSVGSLAAQAKADVNAEVLDVLNVDTFAQPGQESPAATTTLQKMLAYLYKAWRNKTTQTSSEYALYADDATTKDQEAVVSDDGTTTTRGEVSTGA